MIVATAGATAAGVIDPLPRLADLADAEGLALHVDAAWAGAVALPDRWRGVLEGIERADTVTIDAHKWLSQPMGTGMFFARHDEWLRAAYRVATSYMPPAVAGGVDYYAQSPQWSRPFRGLRLFLSLAGAGRRAFEAQIDVDVLHEAGTPRRHAVARGRGGCGHCLWTCVDLHGSPRRAPGPAGMRHELPHDRRRHRNVGTRPPHGGRLPQSATGRTQLRVSVVKVTTPLQIRVPDAATASSSDPLQRRCSRTRPTACRPARGRRSPSPSRDRP